MTFKRIKLSNWTYEELLELEEQIQKAKAENKDRLSKGSFIRHYYEPLIRRLCNRGIDGETFASRYVNSVESSVFKIADITMGNYEPWSSKPTQRIRCNGQLVMSDDNDMYKSMVEELNSVIAKYVEKLYDKEAQND